MAAFERTNFCKLAYLWIYYRYLNVFGVWNMVFKGADSINGNKKVIQGQGHLNLAKAKVIFVSLWDKQSIKGHISGHVTDICMIFGVRIGLQESLLQDD